MYVLIEQKTFFQPTDVILPSGKQYVLNYDGFGNIAEVIMPGLSKHHFFSLTTMHFYRRMYIAPGQRGKYILDTNSGGQLLREQYPSHSRQVRDPSTSPVMLK